MGFSNAGLFEVAEVVTRHSFIVPEFQRGYAWGEDQWKALWDDTENVMRREHSLHYGGAIMVSAPAEGTKSVELIDGQQRLTSISLMLAALGGDGFPIEFRNNEALQIYFDFHALKQSHLGPSLKRYRSYYSRNISNAADYFSSRAKPLGSDEKNALIYAILRRFRLFVLEIQPDFDVHVAFETINNRGKPLSTLEKLKNRLIYLASNAPDETEGKAAVAEVHRCWKLVYAWLGAGKALLDDDDFLRAHAMGWFRHERKADWLSSRLFDEEFSAHGTVTPEQIRAYVRSLELAAACWHLINEPECLPPQVARQLLALQKTPNATSRTLLLWALIRLAQGHDRLVREPDQDTGWAAAFGHLAAKAERFALLVILANDRPANIGQSDISRSAYALAHPGMPLYEHRPGLIPPADAGEAVEFAGSHLASLTFNGESDIDADEEDDEEDDYYIDKRFAWEGYYSPKRIHSVVAERLEKKTGFYNWQLGKLLVYAWEDRLRGDKGRPEKRPWERFSWDESVEHIYPQNPDSPWQDVIGLDGRSADAARRAIVNSLGNLLLLSRSRNSTLSNESYLPIKGLKGVKDAKGKRERFQSGSYSEMQVAKRCSKWTVLQIAARGIAMFRHAQDVWDFEVVGPDEKLTAWLPLLFGKQAAKVQKGDFSFGTAVSNLALRHWVAKFEESL